MSGMSSETLCRLLLFRRERSLTLNAQYCLVRGTDLNSFFNNWIKIY